MGGVKWMRRTIQSGQVKEKYRFRVPVQAKPRGRRVGRCSARKQDANEHAAIKRAARLLNCNFTHADRMLGLSYDDAHYAELLEQAQGDLDLAREIACRDVDKFIARFKYHAKKAGLKLDRYFCVVANRDGDTGEYVRDHAHLIIKADMIRIEGGHIYVGQKDLEDLWGKGSINDKAMRNQNDYTELAAYLMRQVERVPDKAKYKAARGMIQPQIIDEEIDSGHSALRIPKGAKIIEQHTEDGVMLYVRYVEPERRTRRKVRKE